MDEVIKNICQALKEESEAVISCTDKIFAINTTKDSEMSAQVMEAIRLDDIQHIQNLCLELTRLMTAGDDEPPNDQEE